MQFFVAETTKVIAIWFLKTFYKFFEIFKLKIKRLCSSMEIISINHLAKFGIYTIPIRSRFILCFRKKTTHKHTDNIHRKRSILKICLLFPK